MSLSAAQQVIPDWPAPASVRAFSTTRAGGVSTAGFGSLNLSLATADAPDHVQENRRRFAACLPAPPGWLRQVHGDRVLDRTTLGATPPEADGSWTDQTLLPCTVLTADCLPVLFCDRGGSRVAAVHAGWRGLRAGILARAVRAMGRPPEQLLAWIGPAIGVGAYEVGADFERDFRHAWPWLEGGFKRYQGRVHADLPALARAALGQVGVTDVHGGNFCTYTDAERFFSHRRDAASGRMATTIWLEPDS